MRKYGNTQAEYAQAAAKSLSITDMCRNLGLVPVGGNFSTIKRKIAEYNLDVSHFTGQAHNLGKYLVSKPVSKTAIKSRLIDKRGRQCQSCKNTEWLGNPITLELEHVDGNNSHNDYENLLLLCPNCHSYTKTWRRAKSSFVVDKRKICPQCSGPKNIRSLNCSHCRKSPSQKKEPKKPRKINAKSVFCACGKPISPNAKQCIACAHKKLTRIVWPSFAEVEAMVKISSFVQVGKQLGVSDNAVRNFLKNHKPVDDDVDTMV